MIKGQAGMCVKITGRCNGHGFKIGEIVKLNSLFDGGRFTTQRGNCWTCSSDGVIWNVRECDMAQVKAVIL